jgi:hypothetical protein
MHDFYLRNRTAGRPTRLEARHGTREPFYSAMILLDDIIELLGVMDHDGRLLSRVVACTGCRIRTTRIKW